MNQTLNRVAQWIKETPVVSRWPGTAVKSNKGEPDFQRGYVIRVSEMAVHVETERKQLLKLVGDAYPHFCDSCNRTIPGNITYNRPPELRHFCPYCGPAALLRMLNRGEKMKLHYRFGSGSGAIQTDTAWGQYYGEVWDW